MKRLRTAILGCGDFANRHALNLIALGEEIELAAFCDHHDWNAREFSEKYTGGKGLIFKDHREMFEKGNLDLVVICLPPFAHSNEVELAAQNGIHLFIEKPIALASEHAWRMVEAAEKASIKTQVGFMFRFGAAVERLKELITVGESGPAGLMTARYFCNSLHALWWRDKSKSGGQIVEQVIHLVDLMRYLMGEAVSVYSRQENIFHQEVADYTVEDVSATVFGFQWGAIGVIYATNGAIPGKWINDYRLVAQKLTAIRMDGQTRTPLREGAKSLDLALAATRSAESHREVFL